MPQGMLRVVNTEQLANDAGTRVTLRPSNPDVPISAEARRAMKSHNLVKCVEPVGHSGKVAVLVGADVAAAGTKRDEFIAELDRLATSAV